MMASAIFCGNPADTMHSRHEGDGVASEVAAGKQYQRSKTITQGINRIRRLTLGPCPQVTSVKTQQTCTHATTTHSTQGSYTGHQPGSTATHSLGRGHQKQSRASAQHTASYRTQAAWLHQRFSKRNTAHGATWGGLFTAQSSQRAGKRCSP